MSRSSYLLLVVEEPDRRRNLSEQDGRAALARMVHFAEGLERRGVLRATDSLTSDARGVRIRVRDGKRTVVDGPFTEAKEIVGGFFVLDRVTKDEAVAIATECPATEWATVEVREIGHCWDGNG